MSAPLDYLILKNDLIGIWTAGWTNTAIPVFWRDDDLTPRPDPAAVPHFLRNEMDPGREKIMAYGAGRFSNLKAQFGSVVIRVYTSRSLANEDVGLTLMRDAMAIFRSQRITDGIGNDLSFIGEGSGFDTGPEEDGNWFVRGALMVFEYRFKG